MQSDVQSTVIYYQKTWMNLQWRSSEQNPETAENAYPIYMWVKEEFKWQWGTVLSFYSEHSMILSFRCTESDFVKINSQEAQ
jgi:hypothetical protein